MVEAGWRLRQLREKLAFTIRDVERASGQLSLKYQNEDFFVPKSRLSEIETKGVNPSIFRLYSLSVIYRHDYRELLSFYGINLTAAIVDIEIAKPRRSHVSRSALQDDVVNIPVAIDPSFDPRVTTNIKRMVEKWGTVPLAYLSKFESGEFSYAYIGTEDLTMYPLIMPGSFVQIDNSQDAIEEGIWRTEYERPIYFVETRVGYVCSWCSLNGTQIVLQPHPLSPSPVRIMRHPQDAEVIGRVVGIAMQLSAVQLATNVKSKKASSPLKLNCVNSSDRPCPVLGGTRHHSV